MQSIAVFILLFVSIVNGTILFTDPHLDVLKAGLSDCDSGKYHAASFSSGQTVPSAPISMTDLEDTISLDDINVVVADIISNGAWPIKSCITLILPLMLSVLFFY